MAFRESMLRWGRKATVICAAKKIAKRRLVPQNASVADYIR